MVWADTRNELGNRDIYGARVTPDGKILDYGGFPISTANNNQEYPKMAFDGTNYLVVWQDPRASFQPDIYGARIRPDGVVLDTNGILIASTDSSLEYHDVAFGASNYLVVWRDYRRRGDIFGVRVSPAGTVLNSPFKICGTDSGQSYPSVSFNGKKYLVVWQDKRGSNVDIYGQLVDTSGTVPDTLGFPISTVTNAQSSSRVAFDGMNYLVVWNEFRTSYDIYGAKVDTLGNILDPTGIPIDTVSNHQINPSVCFDGTNYWVVWMDNRDGDWKHDIYATRVTPTGTVLEPNGILISAVPFYQASPAVFSSGTNSLIAWHDARNSWNDIYARRVSPAGTVIDAEDIPMNAIANAQDQSACAYDGTNYFVVWADNKTRDYNLYGSRISPSGDSS
ncbi:MAG: hypothetical protein AB1393_10875 [Candidatus Edwardsbacteria bacterium]